MKLKPCPFCGGRAAIWCNVNYEYKVLCKACGIEVNTHCEVVDEAEKAWNRRTNEEEPKKEISRENAPGYGVCTRCKHIYTDADDVPCCSCKHLNRGAFKDNWEAAEQEGTGGQMNWISVKEMLPKDEKPVLAYYGFDRGDGDIGQRRGCCKKCKNHRRRTQMTCTEILQKANECVTGFRQQDYGEAENNFATIASLWEPYLRAKCLAGEYDLCIAPEDVAMLLALMKIARIASGRYHEDNFIDLAGYAACAGEIADRPMYGMGEE